MSDKKIREVMTPSPATLAETASCAEAARVMRDKDVGAIIVTRDNELCGIVTDRDLVVRCMADGGDPKSTQLSQVCSQQLAKLHPDDKVDDAVQLMRKKAIRRIPVIEHDKPVGIVSLGDLAVSEDPRSALGAISQAPPNH